MNMKYLAAFSCILMAVMMIAPICSVNAQRIPPCQVLTYRYYDNLFSALQMPDSSGGIDVMGWPLTASEYNSALNNTGICVEPLSEAGENELAFNNNYTDGIHMAVRSPMNFTDFRNALNCLVNVPGVIAGPGLQGFATESYTQVPTPVMAFYVNPAVSGANYPWAYNVTHALQILWTDGWYSTSVYPTLADLITAYGGGTGSLSSAGGTTSGVVYSGNDPMGQWGGGDPLATANSGVAGTAIPPLQGYVRSSDARKDLGDYFCNALASVGIPFIETYELSIGQIRPFVLAAQHYDFATLGYSFGVPPNWWYSELTPAGIYVNGPNPYLVDDGNTTHYATLAFTTSSPTDFNTYQQVVQYNLVWESYLVAGYCPATYCAYKAGLLGQIDIVGQGTEANGAQTENWVTLNSRKNNTIVYTGPPASTPESNTLYVGLYSPPDMINPIFQDTVTDFQVSDEIFTYPIGGNPYTVSVGSAITGNPSGSDLPWMAYSWKTQLVDDPYNASNPQWTNVTVWLRNDITWQDGQPFNDLDLNYTVYINAFYGDAYDNSQMIFAANVNQTSVGGNADWQYQANKGDPNYAAPYFTQHPSASDPSGLYCCSFLVSTPSWLNLYLPLYQTVPKHIYQYIVPSNATQAEEGASTDGLHGLWPGELATTLAAGAPFTTAQLAVQPELTLVGTGPWKYRVGSTTATQFVEGANITLDAVWNYPPQSTGWFLTPAPGAIAFKYTWLNTAVSAQPSGGYFKIGLADLVYLANAYGTKGTPPSMVPISEVPGAAHSWNPAADLAAPSGTVGLSDLVTLATHYGWYYGNYSYNAPYPPSEVANGGP